MLGWVRLSARSDNLIITKGVGSATRTCIKTRRLILATPGLLSLELLDPVFLLFPADFDALI